MNSSITLHPINYGWDHPEGNMSRPDYGSHAEMETWTAQPEHVCALLRHEYREMRKEGASRRMARWHVHRMLAMIHNRAWTAETETPTDLAKRIQREANERGYTSWDVVGGDPADLAAQLTPEAAAIIESWWDEE